MGVFYMSRRLVVGNLSVVGTGSAEILVALTDPKSSSVKYAEDPESIPPGCGAQSVDYLEAQLWREGSDFKLKIAWRTSTTRKIVWEVRG